MICTVDHQGASHLLTSFTVPIDIPRRSSLNLNHRMKLFPDTLVGPHIIAGAISASGRFLAVVECNKSKDFVKVLALRKAPNGDLTCEPRIQTWRWKPLAKSACASPISMSVQEADGSLEVFAVDGQGHVSSARMDVADMQTRGPFRSFSLGEATTSELQALPPVAGELPSEDNSQHSLFTAITDESIPRSTTVSD